MSKTALTREQILDAAEIMLRRYGLEKASVVDVAKYLNVTHGTIYRHFASKAALREAVTQLWLERAMPDLKTVLASDLKATDKLYKWLRTLSSSKIERSTSDPELFATYMQLTSEAQEVVLEHISNLIEQITVIVDQGVKEGAFAVKNSAETARAVFFATTRFHNPAHSAEWKNPEINKLFDDVWSLILNGIRK